MKKILSIVLTICMAFSVLTVGAASVSAASDDNIALKAGSLIYFDNSNTKWDNVYFYAWQFGFFGDTYEMTPVAGKENLFSMVVPVDVPLVLPEGQPSDYFLFKSAEDWSGKQTVNQSAHEGFNTYIPNVDEDGNITTVEYGVTNLNAETEVLITPSSREFTTNTFQVTLYAFNTENAEYTVRYADNSETGSFTTTSTTITITASATVTLIAGDKRMVQSYKKTSDAVVNVTATGYTGNIYMYTFGGDRVGDEFVLMTKNEDGTYTAKINGSAKVIFTTTNDWETAKKFTINTINEKTPTEVEPLLSAGETYNIVLQVPAV